MSPAASDHQPEHAAGFAPIVAPGARVLVLGSLPSRMSIAAQEYYGNPRNAFWRIMGDLFGAGPALPYAERASRLGRCGVAVWDVLRSSVRPGSLDAAIDLATARPNDFRAFFADYPDIGTIAFNGTKAGQLYRRLVAAGETGNIVTPARITLPSTSPAHAAMAYEDKLRRWRVVRDAAGSNGRR